MYVLFLLVLIRAPFVVCFLHLFLFITFIIIIIDFKKLLFKLWPLLLQPMNLLLLMCQLVLKLKRRGRFLVFFQYINILSELGVYFCYLIITLNNSWYLALHSHNFGLQLCDLFVNFSVEFDLIIKLFVLHL